MSESAKRSRMPISAGSLLWIAVIVWLVMPSPRPVERQVKELRSELKELRREVSLLRTTLAASIGESPASHERQIDGRSTTAADDRVPESHALPIEEHRGDNAEGNAAEQGGGTPESPTEAGASRVSEDLDVERE